MSLNKRQTITKESTVTSIALAISSPIHTKKDILQWREHFQLLFRKTTPLNHLKN